MKRFAFLTAMLAVALCAVGFNATIALALSPAVETLPASSVAEKGATLKGTVNPGGGETKTYFEYGTSTSYGSKTAEVNVGSGSTTIESSQAISGLTANTTYHYRIVANNPQGSSQGADQTFTTVAAPQVTTLFPEKEASGEGATLVASVDPNGQNTTYQFEYGSASGSYTNKVPIPAESAGSGYSPVTVKTKISGLTPGTTYYVRVTASNASGNVNGSEVSFLSSNHPGFKMQAPSEIWRKTAQLNATVESHGLAITKYWFEYGTTASYGSKTAVKETASEVAASASLVELKIGTVYHYRLVAENSFGTHASSDQTVTTLNSVTAYPTGKAEPLKNGTSLKALSTNLTFASGEGSHSCSENEFAGSQFENPGFDLTVTTTRLQTSLFYCAWKAGFWLKYSVPGSGWLLEYAKDASGEGFVKGGNFILLLTTYFGNTKAAECEYSLKLTGTFKITTALEPTLSGNTEVLKGSPYCPGAESVSGKFAVTSGGTAVEFK